MSCIGGFAMGIGYPPNNKQDRHDESHFGGDEFSEDVLSSALKEDTGFDGEEPSTGSDDISVLSLLEENARLRGLVVQLSDLVLRNVVDRS
jgi:hypothetical protein